MRGPDGQGSLMDTRISLHSANPEQERRKQSKDGSRQERRKQSQQRMEAEREGLVQDAKPEGRLGVRRASRIETAKQRTNAGSVLVALSRVETLTTNTGPVR